MYCKLCARRSLSPHHLNLIHYHIPKLRHRAGCADHPWFTWERVAAVQLSAFSLGARKQRSRNSPQQSPHKECPPPRTWRSARRVRRAGPCLAARLLHSGWPLRCAPAWPVRFDPVIGELANRTNTAPVTFRPESPGHASQAPRPNRIRVLVRVRPYQPVCAG